MVLEHVFPEEWLRQRGTYSFLLGVGYTIIGITLATMLFPSHATMPAIAFTSLLLLPELQKLFNIEEREEGKERIFSLKELIRDNLPFVRVYLCLFFGILLTYAVAALYLPSMGMSGVFQQQLEIRLSKVVHGQAIAASPLFAELLANNLRVLLACFFIALLTGDGAIFLITWNASVWGTIFSFIAQKAAYLTQQSAITYLALVLLITMPHMMFEALSYILAAISGGVISKDVVLEKLDTKRFNLVFLYNFVLVFIALVFLVIGVSVETYVLQNVEIYQEIIAASHT